MFKQDPIELLRDCDALLIPTGVALHLKQGSLVTITQALGNAYTVYINGNLARIAGKDGDALGMVILDEPDVNTFDGTVEDKVWEVLKTCFDPEIPVNIVDLGLIYECHLFTTPEGTSVDVKMTLTAPGCGMGPALVMDIEHKIRQINEILDVKIDLVFDPPWNRNMMSDLAKLQLNML